jgi:hypothetical protein
MSLVQNFLITITPNYKHSGFSHVKEVSRRVVSPFRNDAEVFFDIVTNNYNILFYENK